MNLIHSRPPHVRSHESNFSVMGDMVISLVPLYLMAISSMEPAPLCWEPFR